ncbi:MAG: uracil-DNA glycosylase family protein, partial [Acetobacteraceae bacterium]
MANRRANPDWFNAPVPSFGPMEAPLLIVGLAPGVRGANRTGRPFTGDFAGALLYGTLLKLGLARGCYGADPGDGLVLEQCRITNAVRCVPPGNLPVPAEIATCNRFLAAELSAMPNLQAVLALGVVAHGAVLRAKGLPV